MSNKPRIVVVGGGGAQGLECVRYLRTGAPGVRITAIDRTFSSDALRRLAESGADAERMDVTADSAALDRQVAGCALVLNLAGPFYRLGATVLDAAIRAGVHYLDICDDIDATEILLARHRSARANGSIAIIGMGAAPGTTNLLVRLGLDRLRGKSLERDGQEECRADIAWCAPASDLTFGIFQHLVHCFKTALPDCHGVPDWNDLDPSVIDFPPPAGPVEVIRLGHPEPLTLQRSLGCAAILRGGITQAGVMRKAWSVARTLRSEAMLADAWGALKSIIDSGEILGVGSSGMVIDVFRGEAGIRFESSTVISMEQSTAVPAAAGALQLLAGQGPSPGVWPPECLSPLEFFATASRISPGGGGLTAHRLECGRPAGRLSLRRLLTAVP